MGCKTAINILNVISPEQFISAINLGDRAALTQIPGIGKKTAERLILELRDQFAKEAPNLDALGTPPLSDSELFTDVLAALAALGYDHSEADSMLKAAVNKLGETNDLQLLLRTALASAEKREVGHGKRTGYRVGSGQRTRFGLTLGPGHSRECGPREGKKQMQLFIVKQRSEALDHVLLYRPQDWARPAWRTLLPMRWE